MENNHSITFNIGIDLDISNIQHNIYINSVLEELHIYNEIKYNKLKNILNIQTDFKNNILYQYMLDNNNNIP